jgi:hypothetical protein
MLATSRPCFQQRAAEREREQAGRRNYFSTGDNVTFRLKVVNTEYFPGGCSFFLIETIESRSFTSPRTLMGNEPNAVDCGDKYRAGSEG